jgi:maltose/maltodextrin transport system permease protein
MSALTLPAPAASTAPPKRPVTYAIATLAMLAVLWLSWRLATSGQVLVSTGTLALGSLAVYTYASAKTLAWRNLIPGVAGKLIYVALPLLYTMQIGFTNYSSAHLLSEQRARAYLLEQTEVDEAHAMASSLHAEGSAIRVRLANADGSEVLVSPPLDKAGRKPVVLSPAGDVALGPPLPLRQVIARREMLRELVLQRPDGTLLRYAGVREFGPLNPLWNEA